MRDERVDSAADARRQAHALKQTLDSSFDRYKHALATAPIGYQGDMHVYMCIVMAGFLEQVLFVSITGYLKSSTGSKTAAFALSFFRKAPNLKPEALEKLVGRFGDPWATDLSRFLDEAQRRDALGLLLKIRNDSAHGNNYAGSAPSVTTYKRLVDDIYGWVTSKLLS